jgi:1-acyl-sn-glycerol-3-phosphate acyltransferase
MWLYRVNHTLGPVLGLYWRLRLRGPVDAVPRRGPLIVAANHSSFLDPWWLGMAFPRLVRFLITEDWFRRNPAWNAFFKAYGCVPVRRGNPSATVDAVCEVLERGEVVGIFPEGRISTDGKLQRFRSGIGRIAARSGAPVMPVGIRGAFASLRKGQRVPRPARVSIHLGRPVRLAHDSAAGPPRIRDLHAFAGGLHEAVRELTGQRLPHDARPALPASAAEADSRQS